MQDLKNYFIAIDREYKEGDVAVFRQKFSGENVVSAVLYSTALGVYEAELNGKKAGEQMFAPGYTYYPRRVLYQEHDVTAFLNTGSEENELVFYLGQVGTAEDFYVRTRRRYTEKSRQFHGYCSLNLPMEARKRFIPE